MDVKKFIIRKEPWVYLPFISCFADFYCSLAMPYNQLLFSFKFLYKQIKKRTYSLNFLTISFARKLSLIGPFQEHIIN